MINLRDTDKDGKHKLIGSIDTAFRKINTNSIMFQIWKVENNRAEILQPDKYGIFLDDCAYIIYAATPSTDNFVDKNTICRTLKENNKSSNLYRFIHFWLGTNCSSEKSGNVAYKVIELDNYLGNTATQYRETQENECNRFTAYFKADGITILSQPFQAAKIRLFQIKGKIYPKYIQKIPINWKHFKSNYVMVLQTLKYVFIWIGRSSHLNERQNALKLTLKLQNKFNISEIVLVDDGYEQSLNDIRKSDWNQYLNLAQRIVEPAAQLINSTVATNHLLSSWCFKLYKCGFTNNKYRIEELKIGQLEKYDLNDSDAAYIIDGANWCGSSLNNHVWIWLGRNTSIKDKGEAMRNARGFVKKKQYDSITPIIRIIEEYEPNDFKQLFPMWIESINSSKTSSSSSHLKSINCLNQFDALTLLQRPKLAADTQLIDNGSGELSLYKIQNGNFMEISKRNQFALFSGDCFLIHYLITFTENNLMTGYPPIIRHILYLWCGKDCSSDIQKRGEILTNELYEHLQKNAIQFRIYEGYEPAHFLQIFKGKLIIFNGHSNNIESSYMYPDNYILKIIGDSTYNCKAIQIYNNRLMVDNDGGDEADDNLRIESFSSNDCFIIKINGTKDIWVWCGQSSTGDKREMAKTIGLMIGEYTLVLQSNETIEFWNLLSDKIKEKFQTIKSSNTATTIDKCSSQTINDYQHLRCQLYISWIENNNNIFIEQILDFNQKDLLPENIYLLDVGNLIYIWLGNLCSIEIKQKCWKIVKHFLNSYFPFIRNKNTPTALIQQGYEPTTFIGLFEQWNCKYLQNYKSFEINRLEIESNDSCNNKNKNNNNNNEISVDSGSGLSMTAAYPQETNNRYCKEFDEYTKYPIDVLRNCGNAVTLPETINPQRKEIHLTHDDFVSIFNMNFIEFESLPMWKKQELKKLHKLF